MKRLMLPEMHSERMAHNHAINSDSKKRRAFLAPPLRPAIRLVPQNK